MNKNSFSTNVALAEQQLTGFFHARSGYSLNDLIKGMGLTRKEWDVMKLTYPRSFTNEQIAAIDLSFQSTP